MKKNSAKSRLVGINHVVLEVDDIDEALDFYGAIFDFELRGRDEQHAFIDMGDQFLALMQGREQDVDERRHFGLVVDDSSTVVQRAEEAGATLLQGEFLDFLDPWGNRIQVIEYRSVQFSKTPEVLQAMNLDGTKNVAALRQLEEKGMAKMNVTPVESQRSRTH